MARLEQSEVLKLLKSPRNEEELDKARKHEERTRFHCEPVLDSNDVGDALGRFLAWVKGFLPDDKFLTFKHLLATPVATVEDTESIHDELKRIFDAQDRHVKCEFTDPELEQDCEQFRRDMGDFDYWRTDAFTAMKSAIHSVLVVDLPALSRDEEGNIIESELPDRPEPYYNLIHVSDIWDMSNDREGNCEYIIWHKDSTLFYVIDSESYRIFKRNKNDNPMSQGGNLSNLDTLNGDNFSLIAEEPHDLGYTPAKSLWDTQLERSRILRKAPITNSLTALDWLLVNKIFQMHLELYAGFPIYVTYEQECDYRDEETDEECVGGYINIYKDVASVVDGNQVIESVKSQIDCPKCMGGKVLVAPGSVLTAPGRSSNEDPDMLKGIHKEPGDVDSINLIAEKNDKRKEKIMLSTIGKAEETTLNKAINEKQVMSGFETRQDVLMSVSRNFEIIHHFALDTAMRLRYGSQFQELILNYGSKFFLQTAEEINESIEAGKKNGMPSYEMEERRRSLIDTKYKNNPEQRERVKILANLEPYPDLSINEVNLLQFAQVEKKVLKTDFPSYIARFEREVMPVVTFMKLSPFNTKIDMIMAKLLDYVDKDLEGVDLTPDEPKEPSK